MIRQNKKLMINEQVVGLDKTPFRTRHACIAVTVPSFLTHGANRVALTSVCIPEFFYSVLGRLLQGDLYQRRTNNGPYLYYNPYLQEKHGYKILLFANTLKKQIK